jgi:hypothetical protein
VSGIWDRVQAEVEAREGQKGMSPYDLLELPRAQRALMKRLLKHKTISLADAAQELGQPEDEAEKTLAALVDRTFLIAFEKKGARYYKLLLARKAGKELPFNIWDDLSQKLEG